MTDTPDTEELSLADEVVTAFIGDPATIPSHEIALYVIETLDAEIADIQAQIDAAQIRAATRPLSPDSEAWLRRAAYACAMRRREYHRVVQRDKELRGTKNANQGTPEDRAAKKQANLLKQERLKIETEIRRDEKRKEVRYAKAFVRAARATLAPDEFKRLSEMANIA